MNKFHPPTQKNRDDLNLNVIVVSFDNRLQLCNENHVAIEPHSRDFPPSINISYVLLPSTVKKGQGNTYFEGEKTI